MDRTGNSNLGASSLMRLYCYLCYARARLWRGELMKTGHLVLSAVRFKQLLNLQVFLRLEICLANSFHSSPPIAVGSSCVDVTMYSTN